MSGTPILPAVVCIVIMLVNGNVGTGVAVAGAFSLVRFRSAPGTAKEICALFLAMGAGLITGMGYLGFAVLFTAIMCGMFVLYDQLDLGVQKNAALYKTMTVTSPAGHGIVCKDDLVFTGGSYDIAAGTGPRTERRRPLPLRRPMAKCPRAAGPAAGPRSL